MTQNENENNNSNNELFKEEDLDQDIMGILVVEKTKVPITIFNSICSYGCEDQNDCDGSCM